MEYSIHGPFELKRSKGFKNKKVGVDYTKEAKKEFWNIVGNRVPDLPSACGCYLFAIKASKGIKPWYVGLAEKQIFQKECFGLQKINIYTTVINKCGKGTPILFLIAKRTNKGKFVNPSKNGHKDIQYLETILIGTAMEKNPNLMNIKKTKYLKEMCVPGLINTKKKLSLSEHKFKMAIK
jgi:hypothetical protein